jgi:hypothetical protein
MVDDRSPMYDSRVNITKEARNFVARLDASATQYRMAMVSADMQYAKGALRPRGNPVILTKGLGTLDERTAAFASQLAQQINLQTSAFNRGMESALKALTTSFVPQVNVPLVVVFLSYSEDESTVPGGDRVTYYKNALLSLKANKPEQLRVYSVNYVAGGKRCAQEFGNPIDAAGYVPYYFNLATAAGGSTADLCGTFSSSIDLSGLRLKALPKSFTLETVPTNPSSIQVTVSKDGQPLTVKWTYNAATNSIDFDQTPPEGAVIQVVFL